MSAASAYLESEWIKYAFTTTAMGTRPTGWKVRLHSSDPGDTGASEIAGSSYLSQTATWTQSSNQVSNTSALTFPTVTTSGYTVSYVSIWDTAGTPNCLFHGPLAVAKVLAVGDALSFATGELILNVS